MGKHDHCCVPHCTARRDDGMLRSFHHFPDDSERKKKWLLGIRRDEGAHFIVSRCTVVCSDHFLDSDFSGKIPPRNAEDRQAVAGVRQSYRLKDTAVPFFSGNEKEKLQSVRAPPRERPAVPPVKRRMKAVSPEQAEIARLRSELEKTQEEMDTMKTKNENLEAEVQKLMANPLSYDALRSEALASAQQAPGKRTTLLEFYTGMTLEEFDCLYEFLEPTEENIISPLQATDANARARGGGRPSALSLQDQLTMVLVRLRLGLLERDLAYQFSVSESTVSRVFCKWINYLYLTLGSLPVWPSWDDVALTMPQVFKDTYPSTYIIINATEIQVEVPASLSSQSQKYSEYKSHTTHKGLIGIAPNGCITFVSELFTGSISDRALVIESGFLKQLRSVPPGKGVMADRGFEIQDLLAPTQHILNIPPFRGSSGVLAEKDVVYTQHIARVRIHVERVISQVKRRFRILQGVMPLSVEGSMNQIWTVCCPLTNFKGPIIIE